MIGQLTFIRRGAAFQQILGGPGGLKADGEDLDLLRLDGVAQIVRMRFRQGTLVAACVL